MDERREHMLIGGQVIVHSHDPKLCRGEDCCLHNVSDHHMKHWPQNWRGDRGIMERMCMHGVGHPDPDDMSHLLRTYGRRRSDAEFVHGCDGCCNPHPYVNS